MTFLLFLSIETRVIVSIPIENRFMHSELWLAVRARASEQTFLHLSVFWSQLILEQWIVSQFILEHLQSFVKSSQLIFLFRLQPAIPYTQVRFAFLIALLLAFPLIAVYQHWTLMLNSEGKTPICLIQNSFICFSYKIASKQTVHFKNWLNRVSKCKTTQNICTRLLVLLYAFLTNLIIKQNTLLRYNL